jgi:cyclopropane fatty-acyl-phospholipid synthase-like methyltransferase
LLLLIHRLHHAGEVLGRKILVPFAEIKFPDTAKVYDVLVCSMREKSLIQGDAEVFSLTQDGERLLEHISEGYSLHARFYSGFYQAVVNSDAHSLFCERVYGVDLSQHGAADMKQIHEMLDELEISSELSVMDFGCGDGRIAEYISDATGAFLTGCDIAEGAIQLAQQRTHAKRGRLTFCCADLEKDPGFFPPQKFDRIIAIDSLYFVRDICTVLKILSDNLKPGGKMGIFFHYPRDQAWGETSLGAALKELALPYRARDFSAQSTQHWLKKRQVLLELESMFYDEGNAFLFNNRIAESKGLEHHHRYLYIIDKSMH